MLKIYKLLYKIVCDTLWLQKLLNRMKYISYDVYALQVITLNISEHCPLTNFCGPLLLNIKCFIS